MEIKRLPKGIPAGAEPQTQNGPRRRYVDVSEYTRQIAHELDDLHAAWIANRKKDTLAYLNVSPYANDDKPLPHYDWLHDIESAGDRYTKAWERRITLEQQCGQMRRKETIDGKSFRQDVFLTHYESIKLELAYISILQVRMKAVMMASIRNEEQETLGEIIKRVKLHGKDEFILGTLVDLVAAIVKWLKLSKDHGNNELKTAIRTSVEIIRQYDREYFAENKGQSFEKRLARRVLNQEEKRKGYNITPSSTGKDENDLNE